jgi:hypothetical protein
MLSDGAEPAARHIVVIAIALGIFAVAGDQPGLGIDDPALAIHPEALGDHFPAPLLRLARFETDLHESWRLASGDGGANAVLGATLAHTAWMTGAKIGTATPPPVEPPPSVRRTPSALS